MLPGPYVEPAAEHGSVVYRSVYNRWIAAAGALFGSVCLFIAVDGLFLDRGAEIDGGFQLLVMVFTLLMGGLMVFAGVGNIIWPAALLTVTDRGLLFHHDGLTLRREAVVFVPWDRVLGFELRTYERHGSRQILIEVGVRWDESFPPPKLEGPFERRPMTLDDPMRFDALAALPGRKRLLGILRDLHRRYGSVATTSSKKLI